MIDQSELGFHAGAKLKSDSYEPIVERYTKRGTGLIRLQLADTMLAACFPFWIPREDLLIYPVSCCVICVEMLTKLKMYIAAYIVRSSSQASL